MCRVVRSIACLPAAVFALGCMAPLGEFTLVTMDPGALRVEILRNQASGWTCKVRTLLDPLTQIPFPGRERDTGIPDQALAVEMALRTVPGANVLLDMTFIPRAEHRVLWTKRCLTVTGRAARVLP